VISQVFASEGARVVCAARSRDLVEETAAAIKQSGGEATAMTADLSREDDVRELMKRAVDTYGRLDTLVNNAGDGGPTKPVQDYPLDGLVLHGELVPDQLVPVRALRRAVHDPGRARRDREHLVDGRPPRPCLPRRLLRVESGQVG
jgi:NAD(P)-dependent dehydrogenase (short-subunit alcohol dehydrogenase family)